MSDSKKVRIPIVRSTLGSFLAELEATFGGEPEKMSIKDAQKLHDLLQKHGCNGVSDEFFEAIRERGKG